jgi:hypothetical protein
VFCPKCGTENADDAVKCKTCGNELAKQGGTIMSFLRSASQDSTGLKALIAIFVVCALLSLVGWFPLGLPTRLIRAAIPVNITCTNLDPGSFQMYLCSAGVGLMTMAVPLILMLVVFLIRKPITKWVQKMIPKLPEDSRFLVMPAFATAFFVIAWSGAHRMTGMQWGILPQIIFPAVIGLFTFSVTRYGPKLQTSLKPFFDTRDKFPKFLRFLILLAIPTVISLAITAQKRVSQEALKEQFVVIVALVTGFLIMAPRSGDIMAGAQKALLGQKKETYDTR